MRGLALALTLLLAGLGPAIAGIDQVFEGRSGAQATRDRAARAFGLDWLSESRSYALVVGISDYTGGYRRLPTENDPVRFKDFLLEEAGFDHVHVLTEERATKARIEQLMEEVFPALVDGNDRFLLYWSGHGDQRTLPNGSLRGYLPLADTVPGAWSRMISMLAIQRWDDLLPARQALYLLDACFSGLAGTVSMSTPRDLAIEQLARPSRHLLTAGTGEEQAIASDRWGGSLFTTAVLDGLRGAADATTAFEADNVVSLNELVAYIKIRVAQEKERANWRAAITPQLRDLRTNEGEFFFAWPPAGDGSQRPEETPLPGPDAQAKGPSEREVREAQEMLTAMGFAPGPVDGILGLRTRGALLRFQQEQGLVETAALDAATRQALLEAWAGQPRNVQPWAQTRREEPPPPPNRFADLAVFTDTLADGSSCEFCPELVVIPAGTFTMGSPPGEEGRSDDEGPQREARVGRFALGRTEVTVGQFRAFVEASGHDAGSCNYPANASWRDPGFEQTDEHPVACVSWKDADAYVGWLSEQTGEAYRLPSEAEWEFAARAGTKTRYAFGDEITATQANFNSNVSKTTEVGAYPANDWKLFDMHGNVWEWVEDCQHGSYDEAPRDGSAWLEANGGNCSRRVLRGGSWIDLPRLLRSANRSRYNTDGRGSFIGFRVARTLTP